MFFIWMVFPIQAKAEVAPQAFGGNWEGHVIDDITFDETGPYTKKELFGLIQIEPGQTYQARLIREAVKRLYQTEQFKSIWLTVVPGNEHKIVLNIHWEKNLLLKTLTFSGNRRISEKDLFRVIGVKPGDWFSQKSFEEGMGHLRTLYRNKGYFQAEITFGMILSSGKQAGVDAMVNITEGMRTKIRKVAFLGEPVFTPWRLKLRIYSKNGEYYLIKELKEDLLRLRQFYEEEGYFKVQTGPAGVTYHERTNEVDISISIQPGEHLEILFEGDAPYSQKILEDLVLFKKERNADLSVMEASTRQITQFYHSEGYPFAETTAKMKHDPEKGRIEATFTIDSGPRTRIQQIRFSGHYAFLSRTLQEQTGLTESGFFQKSYYSEEAIELSTEALALFYQREGFQHVTVTPEVQFENEGRAAHLLYKIDEGIRTRFERIDFIGNQALDAAQLEMVIGFSEQEPYTREKIRQGRRSLVLAYARAGYLRADITAEVHLSLDETVAEVTYHITEGQQTQIGEIVLEGNETTRDEVILRELKMGSGEPYNPEAILESQKHIYKTGHFSSVRFDPIAKGSSTSTMETKKEEADGVKTQDIRLSVVEKSRIALDFGFGYGDRERFRGFVGLSHQNLWGTGQSLTARMEHSRVEERYYLIHRKPWFFDESLTARTTASYFKDDEVAFDLETFSLVTGVEKIFTDRLTGAFLYQIERKKTTNVPSQAALTAEDRETYTIGTLNPSLLYDTRDDPFNPTKGSVTSLVIRNAAQILASDIQMVKVTVQRRSYFPISKKLVFAFSARIGVAERFGDTENIPIPERFFLGGRNTVRGYDEDELGIDGVTMRLDPAQPGSNDRVPIGGNAMVVFNEELRYTFPKAFGFVLFLDHGNVWPRYQDARFSQIKSTAGIGLRYNTPIGPFRLDWGYKLDREDFESASAFHFTLGHAF